MGNEKSAGNIDGTCNRTVEIYNSLIDDKLLDPEYLPERDHIGSCKVCRTFVRDEAVIYSSLRGTTLAERIKDFIKTRSSETTIL